MSFWNLFKKKAEEETMIEVNDTVVNECKEDEKKSFECVAPETGYGHCF